MATTPGNMELYGTEEAPVSSRTLCAGALSAVLQDGNLRAIRFLDVEILRGIYFLVRDTGWGTYAPVLSALEVDEGDERFSIRYEARCEGAEGRFVYRARIDADCRFARSPNVVSSDDGRCARRSRAARGVQTLSAVRIALAKLEAMGLKVGYPARRRSYAGYAVRTDSYAANVDN